MEQLADIAAELEVTRRLLSDANQRISALEDGNGPRSSRRNMLRLGAAAVAGGAVAAVGRAHPVAATQGTMEYGVTNNAGNSGTALSSSWQEHTIRIDNTGDGNAVVAQSQLGSGITGWAANTVDYSYGVVAQGGAAQLFTSPAGGVAAVSQLPTTGDHFAGELLSKGDAVSAAALYFCTNRSVPGTWRTLAHPNAAGSLFAITPTRVYDSRRPNPAGLTGLISNGQNRTISVADGRDTNGDVVSPNIVPVGATAIAYNLTVVITSGAGNLTVNPGGITTASAASINWNTAGAVVGNASTVGISAAREITVLCGGASSSTHFIVDVVGYYR